MKISKKMVKAIAKGVADEIDKRLVKEICQQILAEKQFETVLTMAGPVKVPVGCVYAIVVCKPHKILGYCGRDGKAVEMKSPNLFVWRLREHAEIWAKLKVLGCFTHHVMRLETDYLHPELKIL